MSTKHTNTSNEQPTLNVDQDAHANIESVHPKKNRLLTLISLLLLYILWGSTYLGMHFALQSFPPLWMAGIRFTVAGSIMFAILCWRKTSLPTRKEWLGATIVGILLLVGGNAEVALAEQRVSSGLSAVAIGAVPLWVALLSGLFGRWPRPTEWYGLGLGFIGLLLLNLGTGLDTNLQSTIILLIAPICWAFGSVCSKHLPMPRGMMSSAAQMLCAGVVLLALGLVSGERIVHWPTASAIWAMLFLIVGGSLVAFTAYIYLLGHVRPALATSYAYVNPAVAVALGAWLAGEKITPGSLIAMVIILSGVVLVTLGHEPGK